MAGTLYAALSLHSYVLSLIFCTAQVRHSSHPSKTIRFQEEQESQLCKLIHWCPSSRHLLYEYCALQVVALLYYTLSYFPGGVHGLKYVLYTFQSAVMRCFLAIVGR